MVGVRVAEVLPRNCAFAEGLRGGIFTTSISAPASTASNAPVNCPAVADQESKLCGAITQVHQQVADLLGSVQAPSGLAVILRMCM